MNSKYNPLVRASWIILLLVMFAACRPQSTQLAEQHPITVTLTPDSNTRTYRFTAHPSLPTTLSFETETAHTSFVAQVVDQEGNLVATLDSDVLQVAALTVGAGDATYTVLISASQPGAASQITILLSHAPNTPIKNTVSPNVAAASTVPVAMRADDSDCRLIVTYDSGVNLRRFPDLNADIMSVLPPDSHHNADARTQSSWYRITYDGLTGWVQGAAVTVQGVCSRLPVQTVALPEAQQQTASVGGAVIPGVTAAYDVDVFYFGIDDSNGGVFQDAVSYPVGDSSDLVQLSVNNVGINEQRNYALTLSCIGNGAEGVRWGMTTNPTLRCGESMPVPFTTTSHDVMITVLIPAGTDQQYAEYTLEAVPTAPNDEPDLLMGVDKDGGGLFQDVISNPTGDTADSINVIVPNLTEDPRQRYRDMLFRLECEGSGAEFVRWGQIDTANLTCGATMILPFFQTANLQRLYVHIPQGSGKAFITYRLVAQPIAPADQEVFLFTMDRDFGGQFNEVLSAPTGDRIDQIELVVSNLSQQSPHNYREMVVTLLCDGTNVDYLRWGVPEDPTLSCNGTARIPFAAGMNRQTIVVVLPENTPNAYVYYALVAHAGN